MTAAKNEAMVRPFRDGDEEALLALHNRAFAEHPDRALGPWRWKYRDNPLKRTEILVAMEGGRCLGVYAGVPMPMVIDGAPAVGGNHIDVATDPALRRGLGAARLLMNMGRRYFAEFAGPERPLTWGFPEPALQRLGLVKLGFQLLRDVLFLVREIEEGPHPDVDGVRATRVDRFDADTDELWNRCVDEIGTGLVRNATYLNWRYGKHPEVPHKLYEARDHVTGTLRGLATAREGGWDERVYSIMDWLVPLEDRAAERALLGIALSDGRRAGKAYLAAWFPAPRLEFHRFQRDHGFFVQATPYQECFRSFLKGLDRRALERSWYQTLGDIDFF